jgi:Uma2 family endonuclease
MSIPPRYLEPADILLVVKVLSPSNAVRDLVVKRYEYAAAGIPDYWIVDRDAGNVTMLTYDEFDKCYRDDGVVAVSEQHRTDRPFPFTIEPGTFC